METTTMPNTIDPSFWRLVWGVVTGIVIMVFTFGFRYATLKTKVDILEEKSDEMKERLKYHDREIQELKEIRVALEVITERLENLINKVKEINSRDK
jgi:Tfp pilus assembly protein PilO